MKKIFKVILKILGILISLLIIAFVIYYANQTRQKNKNLDLLGVEAPVLNQNGRVFRDLNKNGKLDIYEDINSSVDERTNDLLSQMTLEEKAGSMFITMIGMTAEGETQDMIDFSGDKINTMMSIMLPSGTEMLARKKMNSFNILAAFDPKTIVMFNNRIQNIAEKTRLGIPVTIATDPRHSRSAAAGISIDVPSFSTWPTQLGMAATRDTLLVREFGDIARQEYLSVGLRLSLNPMADLGTEPRWTRLTGTYGEDAELAAAMSKAYILGFQGDSLGVNSVACMTKHFSGGGPQEDGMDAHFASGKNQVYPGDNFDYHLIPFLKGVFPAKSAQIMPYYGIPIDQTNENVGFAFNKSIITTLLRDLLKYDGVVCTDWGLITGNKKFKEASAWGVEHLTALERIEKVINAGCDMFGGESISELIIELVNSGKISEERLDISVKRIMRDKFTMGLFDNPYVDEDKAENIAGRADFRKKGKEAQTKSLVLLKNENILPLKKGAKIYIEDSDDEAWAKYGELVSSKEDADVVIKKISTPYSPPIGGMMESMFHQGRLYYNDEELAEITSSIDGKRSIILANLERGTILTEVNEITDALLVQFGGVEDDVLASMIFGETSPSGKLPIELPSSWEAVLNQFEDVPYDSKNPLYPYGFGLTYE